MVILQRKVKLKIINKRGLHARASAKFAAIVDSFKSKVEVTRGNLVVPGNSIMDYLLLQLSKGQLSQYK